MGDTGSLTLGGIIAVFAIIIRKELLIPILCGIFLVENISVMLQVAYFKYTKKKYGEGRRIFKMAPLHHHFQKPGNAGIIANVLARFAVPVFFMVSGYFCFRGDDTEFIRIGKKIRHVLKLMLVAFPVCCLWELIQNHIDGASQTY